ncbi:MAG TPA: metalloregulator ArsR/SmtB family transcription factor [Methylocella sp.]|nr:metalloregulator ArsR/SmtB family transcription factor [Methylocella sp.]
MAYACLAIDALATLGDPTRRSLFERLAERPAAVGELAAQMPISRPAVSQHLAVLKRAGLVTETAQGTRRIYRVDPRGIGAMRDWLDSHWAQALASFAAFADDQGEEAE